MSISNFKQKAIPFLDEQSIQKISKVADILGIDESSLTIEVEAVEPNKEKIKDFQSAYAYIMTQYKPNHNIKPCIAYVLVNGINDGWRVSSWMVAYECLRVYDFDLAKAWNLAKLYLENSYKKKNRNLKHLDGAFRWVLRNKSIKISCDKLSKYLPCVGSREACNMIRGIKNNKGGNNMELLQNQKALYLNRFINYGYNLKLSKKAIDTYFFLLQKAFMTGFGTLYVSHREIAKGINDYYQHIKDYLDELQDANLITYKAGSSKGIIEKGNKKCRIASTIKLIDITGRAENKANMLYEQLLGYKS